MYVCLTVRFFIVRVKNIIMTIIARGASSFGDDQNGGADHLLFSKDSVAIDAIKMGSIRAMRPLGHFMWRIRTEIGEKRVNSLEVARADETPLMAKR